MVWRVVCVRVCDGVGANASEEQGKHASGGQGCVFPPSIPFWGALSFNTTTRPLTLPLPHADTHPARKMPCTSALSCAGPHPPGCLLSLLYSPVALLQRGASGLSDSRTDNRCSTAILLGNWLVGWVIGAAAIGGKSRAETDSWIACSASGDCASSV